MTNCIPHRYDFVYLFDVIDGNPNGDPDAGNLPRTDPVTGLGLVTDVCLKRKIRNYITARCGAEAGYAIYVSEGAVLNEQHRKAYQALYPKKASRAKVTGGSDEEARALTKWMCANFFDIRTFGAVMTTKINCGQVRGPVQLGMARSIDPVFPQELSITRMAATNAAERNSTDSDAEGNMQANRTMGRKAIVPYGLYRVHGFVSAPLAESTGFSPKDLELLWESLRMMWEHDRAAARGEMSPRGLYVFQHQSRLGNVIARDLFDRIQVESRIVGGAPRSFKDYAVTVNNHDLPQGVVMKQFTT